MGSEPSRTAVITRWRGSSENDSAVQGRLLELIVHSIELQRALPMELARPAIIEHDGAEFENFRELARELPRKRLRLRRSAGSRG